MDNQRQFKGVWIPKEIWLNKDLTLQEKIILVEIDSYDDGEIGCFASNKHFVNNFDLTSTRVSQLIQSLQRKGYITINYEYNGKEIIKRFLHINRPPYPEKIGMLKNNIGMLKNEMGVCQFDKGGYVNLLKDNNTYINNINNNKEEILYDDIIKYLNYKIGTNYKSTTKKTRDLIKARFNEGFTYEDFKVVIDKKARDWLNDKKMCDYLRPETLFSNKFEGYLNQKEKNNKKDNVLEVLREVYQNE